MQRRKLERRFPQNTGNTIKFKLHVYDGIMFYFMLYTMMLCREGGSMQKLVLVVVVVGLLAAAVAAVTGCSSSMVEKRVYPCRLFEHKNS